MFTKKTRIVSLLVTVVMLISMVAGFNIVVTANTGNATPIDDASDFASIALDGNYILTEDIDFKNVAHTPIGTIDAPFTGTFDGDGYTISNLTLASDDNFQGLFGVNNGTIRNVKMDSSCSISGNAYVGAIAGKNASTGIIENCISEAAVSYTKSSTVGGTYKVFTQNLCQWGDSEFAKYDTYLRSSAQLSRRPGMLARIKEVSPDLIAFQENSFTDTNTVSEDASWLENLIGANTNTVTAWKTVLENDTDLKSTYTFFGSQGSKTAVPNEGATVAYRTDKFNLLTSGTFWHSTNPDAPVEQQDANWDEWGFGAGNKRVVNWVALEDKTTHQQIVLYSLHPQHNSEEVRMKEIPVLINKMDALRSTYPDAIFIAAGDYNAGKGAGSYDLVENYLNGEMDNAKDIAESYVDESNTKNTSGNIYVGATGTIDHILIDGSAANVTSFEVRDELYDSLGTKYAASEITTNAESAYTGASDTLITRTTPLRPSDHNGVVATFETRTNYAIGGVAGENEGTIRQIVTKATAPEGHGSAIGTNNGNVVAVYGTGTVIADGTTAGAAALPTEPTLEVLWMLNHSAGEDVFCEEDGDYALIGSNDTVDTPVRVRVNGKDYYTMPNSGTFDLDLTGIKDPTLIQDGKLIEGTTIEVGDQDMTVAVADSIMNVTEMATTGVNDFVINNQDELEYADSKLSYINKENVILYLGADIDLTDTTFDGFSGNVLFSFDGLGKTIKNWKKDTLGFFHTGYQGKFIKNVNFENVHLSGGYGRSVVVAMAAGTVDFVMENVHLNNCSTTATGSGNLGGLIYTHQNATFSKTVTLRNISAVNCAIKRSTFDFTNSGVITGRAGNGVDYKISDVYIDGFKNYANTQTETNNGNGFLLGTLESNTVTIDNIGIFNSKHLITDTEKDALGCVTVGRQTGGTLKATNVFTYGTNAGAVHGRTSGTRSFSGCYTDLEAREISLKSAAQAEITATDTEMSGFTAIDAAKMSEMVYDFNEALSSPAIYWEIGDAGTPVAATAAERTRKVTVKVKDTDTVYYADGGETLEISDNAEDYFYVVEGNGTVNGGVLTVSSDMDTVVRLIDTDDLAYQIVKELEYFEGKDLSYYNNGAALATLVEDLKNGLKNGTYTSDLEAQAAIVRLEAYKSNDAYVYATPDGEDIKLPSVQEIAKYPDAPGYMINSVEDLLYVKSIETTFTADHTLYLGADLDLKGVNFVGFLKVAFNFDGLNHTISNWGVDANLAANQVNGLFRYSSTNSVKNLKFDGADLTTSQLHVALIFGCHNTTENTGSGTLTISNIHIKNSKIKNTAAGQIGYLLSNIQNARSGIVIENCSVVDSSVTGNGGNVGALVGRTYNDGATFSMTNCLVNRVQVVTTYNSTSDKYSGILMGSWESDCNGTIANVAVMNSSINIGPGNQNCGVVGSLVGATNHLKNILTYNNTGATSLLNGSADSVSNCYFTEDLATVAGFTQVREDTVENGMVTASFNDAVTSENGYTYWTIDDTTGLPTFGTKANQTLTITYKVGGKVVETDYADGGETAVLGVSADANAIFAVSAGTLAADGKTLTMPTDGSDVVVTVTPSDASLFEVYTYDSVTTVEAAVTSGNYTVANLEEWMYLNTNVSWFNNLNVTIHLIGDVDFSSLGTCSDITGFYGFAPAKSNSEGVKFSLNGHGYSLKNWIYYSTNDNGGYWPGRFASILPNYMGKRVENIVLENMDVSAPYGSSLLIGGKRGSEDLIVQNIEVRDCTLTRTVSGHNQMGLIMAKDWGSSSSLTFSNIKIINSDMLVSSDNFSIQNAAFILGSTNGSSKTKKLTFEDIYVVDSVCDVNTAAAGGILGAAEEGVIVFNNVGVVDTVFNTQQATTTAAVMVGVTTSNPTSITFNNCFATGITSDSNRIAWIKQYNTTRGTKDMAENCYSDFGNLYAYTTSAAVGAVEDTSKAAVMAGIQTIDTADLISKMPTGEVNAALSNPAFYWTVDAKGNVTPCDVAESTHKADLVSANSTNAIKSFYANAGESVELIFEEDRAATFTKVGGSGELDGKVLTMPKDGSVTKIQVNTTALDFDYLAYDSVSTVTAALTAGGDYTIYNESDWAYVETNIAYFRRKDVTIHLAADIDLSKISFKQFQNPAFSFDGHGYTVSNWGTKSAPVSTSGMFVVTNGNGAAGTVNFIKNLNFYNCYITAAGTCSAMLYGSYQANAGLAAGSVTDLLIDNIHFDHCGITVASTAEGIAFILSRYSVAGATSTVTINNCSVIDSTLGGPNAIGGHYGLLIGKPRNGNSGGSTTYNLTNCYMEGSTVEFNRAFNLTTNNGALTVLDAHLSSPTSSYGGLIFGTAEEQGDNTIMKLNNIGVVGCTLDMGDYVRPVEEGVRDTEVGVTVANLGGTTQGSPIYANGVIFKDNKVEGAKVSKVYIFGGSDIRQMTDVYCDTELTTAVSGNASVVVTAETANMEGAGDINVAAINNKTLYWTTNESDEALRGSFTNATRRVSFQVGGKEVARGPVANGGTTVALSLAVDPDATFSGDGVDGKNYTVPTDAPMLAPVAVTYSNADLITASSHPAVSSVKAALTAGGNYTIYNEADWDYLETNIAYFQRKDVTIHLAADIDLSKITFAGFQEPAFSFDGHGFTVRNWGSSSVYVTATAMFVFDGAAANGGADFIKNLNIEDCYVSGRAILVGGVNTNGGFAGLSTNFTVENVHIKDSGLKGNTNFNAFFIGGYGSTDGNYTVNLKNCSLIDSTMVGGGSGHAGLLVGKISGNGTSTKPTYNVSNIYMAGNTFIAGRSTAHYEGMILGSVEMNSTINVSNLVAIGNTATHKHTGASITTAVPYFGNLDQGAMSLNGIVLQDNTISNTADENAKKYLFTSHSKSVSISLIDVYCDDTTLTADHELNGGSATILGTEALISGKAAATVNNGSKDSPFFYTTTEDGVALGTEANATRRVSYQINGREVQLAGFANGGEQMELSYTAPYDITLVAVAGSIVEDVLTLPTAGYMTVPVVVTPADSAMQTVYGYAGVKTVGAAVTTGDYTVANAEEWMYVYNNKAFFNNLGVTLHLIGTIDLSESVASGFNGFQNTTFSVDGHDHIIKNWATESAPISNHGLFVCGGASNAPNFIKNFVVDNAHVNAIQRGDALVYSFLSANGGYATIPQTFTMENVHVKNSTFKAYQEDHAFLISKYITSDSSAKLIITDCSVVDSVLDVNGKPHTGVLFGKNNGNETYNVYDNYINNVTLKNAHSQSGLILGTIEGGTVNIQNNGVFNSKIVAADNTSTTTDTEDTYNISVIGAWHSGSTTTRYNLFAGNTFETNAGTYLFGVGYSGNDKEYALSDDSYNSASINHTSLIDVEGLAKDYNAEKQTGVVYKRSGKTITAISSALFENGYAAYTNNGYNGDLLADRSLYWTVDADGNTIPADGNRTRKVTFTVVDEEGKASTSQAYTYYTDYTKKLIPEFDEYLYKNYTWTNGAGERYTLDKEFTSDVAYTAVGVVLDELQAAINYFNGKELAKYFEDAAGIQALLDAVNKKIAENEYQASENTVPGLGFASLDKDLKLLKERHATYQTPNATYSNVPTVGMIGTYADSPNYTINNLAEFKTAKSNELKYSRGSTLHLMTDLDLSGYAFPGFNKTYFNFDGHGSTITNWTYDGGSTDGIAFISRGAATSIKNLTFDGVTLTAGRHLAVVYASHNADNTNYALADGKGVSGTLTVENVHVKNAVLTSDNDEQVAVFLPNTQSGRTSYVFNNCSIVNATVNTGGKGNVSGFVARLSGGVPVTITNSYIEGLSIPNGGGNTSVFCGQPHSSGSYCSVENVAAYDCNITATGDVYYFGARQPVGSGTTNAGGQPYIKSALLSGMNITTDGDVYLTAGNVDNVHFNVITKNDAGHKFTDIFVDETTNAAFTGTYNDVKYPIYHVHATDKPDANVFMPTVLDAEEFENGKAAWRANGVVKADTWLVGDLDAPASAEDTDTDYATPIKGEGLSAPRKVLLTDNRTATPNTTEHYSAGDGLLNAEGKERMGEYSWLDAESTAYTVATPFTADKALTLEEIIGVDVAWGEIEFVYDFGEWDEDACEWINNGWSLADESDNGITLANSGTVYVEATMSYTATEKGAGISGSFTDSEGEAADVSKIAMDADGTEHSYTFGISGTPETIEEGEVTIGTLKITVASPSATE